MENIYYIDQGYHDITIFNGENKSVLYAKRSGNWLGKITTTIKLDSGEIIGTFYSNILYKNFKIIKNTTLQNINFKEKSKKLIVDDCIIEEKNDQFLRVNSSILVNGVLVLKTYPINILSTNYKLKIEIIHNNNYEVNLALIYILLTLDILIS